MKIVVLDGYTLNPGDLSWDPLHVLGECIIYDRTLSDDVISRSENAEIVLTNKVILDKPVIETLSELKYIGILATGYNVVDIRETKKRNILVTNVPEYGTASVAQMVFAHLLELTQHVGYHVGTVRQGQWSHADDFCYWDYPLIELKGLTMGIVGLGRIGRSVAELAKAFGMHVLAYDITDSSADSTVQRVDMRTLFSKSDVISLHCPLTSDNRGFINRALLSGMKKTAFLINTGRGPLINEKDLADALNNDQIAGAGLDVLTVEPPANNNPLLAAKNCHITPHIAWATKSARRRLMNIVVENVKAYIEGKPQNVIVL